MKPYFLYLLIILPVVTQSHRLDVKIEPDELTAVKRGDELKILCKAPMALQVCRFVIPREGNNGLILTPGQISDDGIYYYGDGLEKGYCGIRLAKVRENDDGNYTCAITPRHARTEWYNSVRVIVAEEPSTPVLYINQNSYRVGEKMDIACHSDGGRLLAFLSLFLGTEQIQYYSPPVYGFHDKSQVITLKSSRVVKVDDNGKTLICKANYATFPEPKTVMQTINVQFPPEKQKKNESFIFYIGQAGKVNVTMRANPMPTFIWSIDGQRIPAGQSDQTNRIQTSVPIDQGHGIWIAEFFIDSIQTSDAGKDYVLEAINKWGSENYRIILSAASRPPANQSVPVEIVPDKQTMVRQGNELKIVCKVPMAVQSCRFVIPREGNVGLMLKPGQNFDDGIDYFGEGLEKGHCGIKLTKVGEDDDGMYTCAITPKNARAESYNGVRISVSREQSGH